MSEALLTQDEFTEALIRVLDDNADDTDRRALDHALIESEPHRHLYRDLMLTESALAWGRRENDPAHTEESAASEPVKTYPIYRKGCEPQPFKLRAHHYGLAAAALLAACGLAAYVFIFSADPQSPDDPPQPSDPIPVATLIHNTGDLRTPHGYPAEGDDYGRGEYTLSTGTAEFMLTNAVNVKLRGDTRMVMRNDMNVALSRGSAAFVVPKDAKGFTVHLPGGGEVVDLGTAFTIEADAAGDATVRVTDGIVLLRATGTDAATQSVVVHAPSVGRFHAAGRKVELQPHVYIDRDFNDGRPLDSTRQPDDVHVRRTGDGHAATVSPDTRSPFSDHGFGLELSDRAGPPDDDRYSPVVRYDPARAITGPVEIAFDFRTAGRSMMPSLIVKRPHIAGRPASHALVLTFNAADALRGDDRIAVRTPDGKLRTLRPVDNDHWYRVTAVAIDPTRWTVRIVEHDGIERIADDRFEVASSDGGAATSIGTVEWTFNVPPRSGGRFLLDEVSIRAAPTPNNSQFTRPLPSGDPR